MSNPALIAPVRDHRGEPFGEAQPPLRLGQQHYPAVGCDPSSIEGSAYLLARYRWKVEGQRDILVHESLPLLVLCALAGSVTGIMLQIGRVIQ